LTALINDLLDIDKLEANKLQLQLKPLDLNAQLQAAKGMLSSMAYDARVDLRLPATCSLQVVADEHRLQQVLANLLSNAIKFSPLGGIVTLSTEQEQQQVHVSITDQGDGIPLEFQPNVFKRFAQADATATRQRGGTGLGLAISRSLMRAMHGRIGFISTPGQGCCFWISLPVASVSATSAHRIPEVLDSNGAKAYEQA